MKICSSLRACQFFFQPPQFDGQLCFQIVEQPVGVALEDHLDLQLPGHVFLDGHQTGGNAQLAVGEGVEGVDGLLGVARRAPA